MGCLATRSHLPLSMVLLYLESPRFLPALLWSGPPGTRHHAQVSRYRHAASERERQQSKLLLSALVVASGVGLLFLALNFTLELDTAQTNLAFRVFQPVLGVIPIALIIGLLHYRLWDIDGVVNRALVYGLVTGIVAVSYLVIVFLLGRLLGTIAGPANLVVDLASTLAVAAMFSPVRRSVQKFIDSRFYRQRYNEAMTLDAFSARCREEVDFDSLVSALLGVVKDTMHPAHLSLWVRAPTSPSKEPVGAENSIALMPPALAHTRESVHPGHRV